MQNNHMHEYARQRLEKAADDLDTAEICYKAGKYDAAANRAYYAAYHAIRAVLALDNIERRKHSGNISYFREHYIATNVFDRKYSETIKKAEILRNDADYKDMHTTSADEAEDIIEKANGFYSAVRAYVKGRIGCDI
ncbi:MAG: HEPN domain-containing protein [Oscillospiraceae bacterium]|nr:HEPN domain-containing protein [Oscillospiraceae bacterium]MCL2278206.1 HEPN domain-containing protein [Oscillospiraceae bacterium]